MGIERQAQDRWDALVGSVARRWSIVLWLVAGVLLVIMAVPALATAIQPLDDWVWELAVSAEQPTLVAIAEVLDVVGGLLVMLPVMIVVALLLAWQRRWPALAVWVISMLMVQVASLVLKELYDRPRPPLPLVTESGTGSFPSGQAATAAAVAIALVLLLGPRRVRPSYLVVIAVAYAVVMALSRVYLRVHWFTDVVEGLALGAATTLTVALIVALWSARSGTRQSSGRDPEVPA